MAFHSLMMRLVAELRIELAGAPTVIELGNQTFKPRRGDLRAVAALLSAQRLPFDAAALRELESRTGEALVASTADYYHALGFASYHAIDVNAKYDSLVMDLNRDVARQYGFTKTFDLVTNNGTGEHIFNQSAVFSNAHALCKVGGVMLHVLPFVNYLNHGFFSYNPILFHDLAAANGYELIRLSVASNHGFEIGSNGAPALSRRELQERCAIDSSLQGSMADLLGLRRSSRRHGRPLSAALRRVMRSGPNVSVVAALRRKSDEPFLFPIQGMYGGTNIDDVELREAYAGAAGARA